jgi:cysteine desulfurase / selenocysteine lyase
MCHDWGKFRRQMPITGRWAYLDHAAVAPLSGPAADTIAEWGRQAAAEGDVLWPGWAQGVEDLRGLVASMVGATPDEIALLHSTTEGVNAVAEGYPWQPGDNVVILADEFPTNQYAWLHLGRLGVETRRVATIEGRVDLDELAAACDVRTRVLAFSWVGYSTGWRHDLDAMCQIARRTGSLVFLDAIQALGVFPIDVRSTPIDFLAADGHKWMLGPEGAGVFFCRREHLDLLRPTMVGWNSVAGAHDFQRIDLTFRQAASRYEGGSQNMVGMLALKASLELLARYGAKAIGERIVEISTLACERLARLGARVATLRVPGHESGIVAFEMPGRDPMAVRRHCLNQSVVLSCRAGRLRVSVHAYNNEDDLDRLTDALKSLKE